MKRMKYVVAGIACLLIFCASQAQPGRVFDVNDSIQLIHLVDSIYIHETWVDGQSSGNFSSNGTIVIKDGEAIMIDTPIKVETTRELREFIEEEMGLDLVKLIIGHFHIDCMGGLPDIQEQGIESVACSLTIDTCRQLGLPIPSTSFTDRHLIDLNGMKLECRHFGGGHTFDNIVVWMPGEKVLFGGCLIKEIAQNRLYALTDEEADEWIATVMKIKKAFPDVLVVIPGHGRPGGEELLSHTIELVDAARNE